MPRKKNLRIKVNARIASKVREKELIEKAKALMRDPELILPDCDLECVACPFKKTRARLHKIAKYKDDPSKLGKFSKRGDRLARAYAATIGLAHEEKAPYLASAKYPGGTVMYALRGRTHREKLIAVQNYDSPKWRVLSVLDLVKKKGLHFYSYDDRFICTARSPNPPDEYVASAARSVGATRREGDVFSCPHAAADTERLEFEFVNTDKKVMICPQCCAKNKNTLTKLAEGMAVPNVLHEFDISVERPLTVIGGGSALSDSLSRPVDASLLERYASGEVGDRELIERHFADVQESLEERDELLYIRGDRSFGNDMEAFVRDLTGDDVEASALKAMLKEVSHPVVIDMKDTVNSLMARFWREHGLATLEGVVPEEVASACFRDDDESVQSPMRIVRQAVKKAAHARASSRMPSYPSLSRYSGFVDKVVRAYKTRGPKGANAVLDGETSNDHRMRSIAHAFRLALGDSTEAWRFTNEEQEFGKHLSAYAKNLFESDGPEGHHKAFVTFMKEAGSTEDIKRSA